MIVLAAMSIADTSCIARGNTNPYALSLSLSGVTETAHFVAREEELAIMHEKLNGHTGRRTVVIHGLGGMGKTQLAVEYMKRHREDYSALLWLNARDETSLGQSFRDVAKRIIQDHPSVSYIQNAVSDKDDEEAVRTVKRWLSEPRNNRWLLVYDNYDHPQLGNDCKPARQDADIVGDLEEEDYLLPKGYNIHRYLPDIHHGAVVVTTRSSLVDIGELIRLQKLKSKEDSLHILKSTSRRQETQDGMLTPDQRCARYISRL